MAWSFDPTELVGFDLASAVYPSGSFSAAWGKLTVEHGGVLVENDLSRLRVGAPKTPIAPDARTIQGEGWALTLNPDWSLRADPARKGSLVAIRD